MTEFDPCTLIFPGNWFFIDTSVPEFLPSTFVGQKLDYNFSPYASLPHCCQLDSPPFPQFHLDSCMNCSSKCHCSVTKYRRATLRPPSPYGAFPMAWDLDIHQSSAFADSSVVELVFIASKNYSCRHKILSLSILTYFQVSQNERFGIEGSAKNPSWEQWLTE